MWGVDATNELGPIELCVPLAGSPLILLTNASPRFFNTVWGIRMPSGSNTYYEQIPVSTAGWLLPFPYGLTVAYPDH